MNAEAESSSGSAESLEASVATDAGDRADIEPQSMPRKASRSKVELMDAIGRDARWTVGFVAQTLYAWLANHAEAEPKRRADADGVKFVLTVPEKYGATLRRFANLRGCSERTAVNAKRELVDAGLIETKPTRLGLRWFVIVPEKAITAGRTERRAELDGIRQRRRKATGTQPIACPDTQPIACPDTQPIAHPDTQPIACAQTDHETDHETDHHHQKPPPQSDAGRGGAGGGGGGDDLDERKGTGAAEAATGAGVTLDAVLADLGFTDGKVPPARRREVLAALIERQPTNGYRPADHARVTAFAERIVSRTAPDGLEAAETAATLDGLLDGLRPPDRSEAAHAALIEFGVWPERTGRILAKHPPRTALNAVKVATWCRIGPPLLSTLLLDGQIERIGGRTQAGQTVRLMPNGEIRRADGVLIDAA